MKEKMAELFKVSDWRLDETNEKRFLVEVYLASDRWQTIRLSRIFAQPWRNFIKRNMVIVAMLCKSFKARSLILVILQLPNMFKVVSCEVNALSYMEVLNKELLRHLFIY